MKVLCEEALRLGVDFLKGFTGVQILKTSENAEDKSCGILAINRSESSTTSTTDSARIAYG